MEKKKRNIFGSLYWQISIAFIIVLVVFATITLYISVQSARSYATEVNQKLNRNLAKNTVDVVKPFLDKGKINQEAIEDIVHSMMVINPSVEVYLLDTKGKILSYVAPEKVVKLKSVSLDPIFRFLQDKRQNIIYGDDPRNPGESKIFSAAEVIQDNQLTGYIYIVLASQEYISASHTVLGSYILGLSFKSIIAILIISAVIGLLAFRFITNKLKVIIKGIKQFESGDLQTRIPVKKESDLDEIALVFNDMAGTIEKNIEELRGVDKLRKELISNISHDLRTPVASIQGYAETLILKKDDLSKEEQQKFLEIIYKSCEKLKKLVSDLFDLTKLQTNQVKLMVEPFSIVELIHDVANKYRIISQKKGVSINTIVSGQIPVVEADLSLIDRVLQNLIDNAIRFCKEGDAINIEVNTDQPENVKIRIHDTGEGIDPKRLPYIFERYYKAKEINQSTGLGLAIVKKIMDLHNETIEVESVKGKGTTFQFTLPIAKIA
jgi:signal transduction histidine kinase